MGLKEAPNNCCWQTRLLGRNALVEPRHSLILKMAIPKKNVWKAEVNGFLTLVRMLRIFSQTVAWTLTWRNTLWRSGNQIVVVMTAAIPRVILEVISKAMKAMPIAISKAISSKATPILTRNLLVISSKATPALTWNRLLPV